MRCKIIVPIYNQNKKQEIMESTVNNLKESIRNDIDDLDGTWLRLSKAVEECVQEIETEKKAGISPIPILEFNDLLNNTDAIDTGRIKKRGCLIIKNVFPQRM